MFVRTTSHRSREKLLRAVGREVDCYVPASFDKQGYFYELTDDEALRVLPIKGCTRARVTRETLWKCWK